VTPLAPERIEARLRERFPGVEIRRQEGEAVRDHTLFVPAASLVEICTFLRDDPELDFALLSWIAGVDWLPREPRFEVVYGLLSLARATRITLKVALPGENPRVPTVTGVWPSADWLKRILLPEDWSGWPLRKDSPLGYDEVAFTHNTPERVKPAPELTKLKPKKVRTRAR
jgi:NADH-quinone oxidoreductase subunit C